MMIRSKTIIWFLVVPLILVLFSCSKGSEEDTIYICEELTDHWISDSPPITLGGNLSGSYHLSGFDADFYTAFNNYIKTITEVDLETAIGTMLISPTSVDQNYSFVGTVGLTRRWYLIYGDETYIYNKGTVSWADTNSGTVVLDGVSSPFTASGDSLSITYPMWCFLLEATAGT